jgi:hypothetical protein
MADKNISLHDLTILNDESLVFLRRAVKILEAQSSDSSIAPIPAVGTITITTVPFENETFIISTRTFTWKNLRTVAGEITRGVNGVDAAINLVTSVNVDLAGIVTCVYIGLVDTFPTVLVTAVTPGIVGNSIIFKNTV